MSVVVRTPEGKDRIISKGAPEAIFPRCKNFELDGQLFSMENILIVELQEEYERLSRDGFRVLAIASKDVAPKRRPGLLERRTLSRMSATLCLTATWLSSTRQKKRLPLLLRCCNSTVSA